MGPYGTLVERQRYAFSSLMKFKNNKPLCLVGVPT